MTRPSRSSSGDHTAVSAEILGKNWVRFVTQIGNRALQIKPARQITKRTQFMLREFCLQRTALTQ